MYFSKDTSVIIMALNRWTFPRALLPVLWFGVVLSSVNAQQTTQQFSDEESNPNMGQTPALKPEEKFRDMFPLTSGNFTSIVMRTKDPWIVIFHEGSVDRSWKTMATHVRGLAWIGIIDVTMNTDLVNFLDYDASRGIARVYPHGNRMYKERNWKYVRTELEAKTLALTSLPDVIQEIDGDDIQDVLTDSFMSKPSRFPVFLILDQEETPTVFKALSLRFQKYFLFSKLINPSKNDLQSLGLGDKELHPPDLYILVTAGGKIESAQAVHYDSEVFGGMNYTKLMEFLFTVNSQFRHELPGANFAQQQMEAEMADVVEIEQRRFEIVHDNKQDSKVRHEIQPQPDDMYEDGNFRFKVTKSVGVRDEL